MADNLTTATIDVRANTRGLEQDILKALKTVEFSQIDTKKSSQALGRITGQVSEFNKSLEASNARVVAFGASAGAIFAVEKAISSLISSTVEVEKKLTDINVLLNLSSSGLEKFGSSLFGIAKNTAQSFSAVADAATELSRQGLGVEETLKRTNAALILTRLSGLDAKSSVDALTATLNSFSGSALDAVGVVNKLANVDAAFAVSSGDLANAISRVGSTAQDAGVSLDELIALVTSAQQTTARGGAVIGNSFKTIFTRLQRGKVQDLLTSLGIDVGEGQSAISLLQQLATVYDTLGSAQKSAVAEQVGGVFQINILKAALADLGKEYSVYGQALNTSLSSTDQAVARNEALNKTVSALSSKLTANLQQAANKIGSIVFEPNAKGFLSGMNNLLDSFNGIDSESAGGKLMEGFFKGVGDFISGPGAILATGVIVKLFAKLGQFASGSLKELLGRNEATKQQAAMEQSVLGILQKNSEFTNKILSGKMSTVKAEQELLSYLTAQSNILKQQEVLSKTIAANLSMKGVSIGSSGVPVVSSAKSGKKAAASGYIPNFASEQAIGQAMENSGARQHGYKAGKATQTTIHDGNGKSFKSFVNSKEDVKTFTNADGRKATVVRPPNGFGKNTQYAAGGFVPNFAEKRIGSDFGAGSSLRSLYDTGPVFDMYNDSAILKFQDLPKKYDEYRKNARSIFDEARNVYNKSGKNINAANKYVDSQIPGGFAKKLNPSYFDKPFSENAINPIAGALGERDFLSANPSFSKLEDYVGPDFKNGDIFAEVKVIAKKISQKKLLEKVLRGIAYSSTGRSLKNKNRDVVSPNLIFASALKESAASGFVPNFASGIITGDALRGNEYKAALNLIANSNKPVRTILGPSGVGKTTRASEMGGSVVKSFQDLGKYDSYILDRADLGFPKDKLVEENLRKIFDKSQSSGSLDVLFGSRNTVRSLREKRAEQGDKIVPDRAQLQTGSGGVSSFVKNIRGFKEQYPNSNFLRMRRSKGGYQLENSNFADGFIPNFAGGKMQDRYKKTQGISSMLSREETAKRAANKGIEEKKLGKVPITMIHGGSDGAYSIESSYTGKNKQTGKDTKYTGNITSAGLSTSRLKGKEIQQRVGDALVGSANDITKVFNPSAGEYSSASQLANSGAVGAAAGTVFESALRKAFDGPAKTETGRIDFPNPSSQLQAFFNNAPVPYEAKITDTPGHRSETLGKYIAVNGLSAGYVPNFAKKSGISFSQSKEDEFGIRALYAKMGGKNVGRLETSQNKDGVIDIGDISVDKANRGKGISSELYKEAIKRSAGKKMKGQLLPQMNRLLEKIKKGEPVSAETLFPQIKRADLAKDSVFEVYGHKGNEVEKMTRDQFSSLVNGKINELKKDPKRLQSYFGNIEADDYGGLGIGLTTQHSSGFVPNFAKQKLADSPAFTNFYTDPAKPGVLEVGSIQNFEGPEQAAVVEKYLKNKIAQLGIKQIDGGSTNLPPRYLKKYSQRLGVPISGYIGGDKFGSLSKKRQAAYDPYTTSKNIFGGREFNVKSGGFVPNFAARVGIQKQRNALANSESGNIVAVHRIKPLIKDGKVSFPPSTLPTGGAGGAMVHHLEGMSGPGSHFPFANFLRLAKEREMDPRFFARNNFEWYYPDTDADRKNKGLSSGFVPNFSQALNDAIAREKSSGLSSSQIYTDTHPSLKNKNNPMGLMVANTRDEPLGGFQGVNRAKREGRNPSTYGGGMSSGFVPNFATGPIKPSQDYLNAMNAALKSVTSTIDKTDKSVAKFGDEVSKSGTSVGGGKGLLDKTKGALGGAGRYAKDNALSLGFGLQAIASSIGEVAGNDETKGGRKVKAVTQGIGTVAGFAGTGAMFGPWGAAIGAGIGVVKAFSDGMSMVNSKVPDLERALQSSSDQASRFAESGQKLLQLNEQYSSALTSGNPTQAADIMVKTQQAYAEELSKLTQAQRDSFISAVAQGKGQEAYAKILSEMQNSVQAQATRTSLQKFSESKSWMGMGSPDTSLIKGIDKTLSSDFAGGLNAEDIGKALRDAAPALQDKSAGTENQALALMQSLAKSDALSADKKNNLQKIIDAFADAAGGTDLSAVSEAFIKSIQGKPKSFEDTKKAQEAAMAAEKIKAQKVKDEIAIRERANASLLKLQSDTESVYERFNNSIEDFISTVESAATMRENAGQFREDFNSAAGAPNAAAAEREKNIVRGSKDKLTVDIYKSQLEASNNFNSATDSLLNGLDVDIAKLGVGATGKDQQNQLLEVRSSIQQALLPIQGMIMGGDYQGAREKTKEALSGLSENQVGAVGADAIQKVGQQLDNSIKEGARKADLIYKNSQKDLAIQAQQLIFQKATAQLTKAQNFGGNNAKDIIKNSPDTEFNKAASALDDLRILGYNQESLQKNAKQPGDTSLNDTYSINDRKNNRKVTAAESGALLDFYSAASNINAGPVMSSDSKDFGVLTEALSVKIQEGLKNIQEKNKANGGTTSVVDQSVITRLQASLATLGGGDMVAKLKLMKEMGVANVGGKQVQDEALKRYSGGAFASMSPDLKKAFEATTDENAGATLLLVAGQDKQTQSLNQGFEFLSANGQTTNDILSNQPAAIADAIGAILEKGRTESDRDTKKDKANDMGAKLEETKGSLEAKKKEILASYAQMDEAKKILGEPGQGVSNEEFIKQQESSIDKDKLAQARKAILDGRGDDKPRTYDSMKQQFRFDNASKIIEKADALEKFKGASADVSNKSSEWQGLEKTRVQQAKDFGWAKNDEATANAKVEQASLKALELSKKTMPYDRGGGDAAAGYYATEKQKAASRAQALGADNLQPSALQKQARDRTFGKEQITTGDGIRTYESAANTQFGEGSNAAFEDLVSKNVLPSLEKFGKIYEQISEGGGAKGQFERMKGNMLGVTTPAPGATTTAPGAQTEIAKGVADGIKRSQAMSTAGGGITVDENAALKNKYGYVTGEGFKTDEKRQAYNDELKALKKQKADSAPQVGALQQAPPKSQSDQTLKNPQEQKPPQQENVNQLISSILDTVKGIANEFNKEKVSGEGSTNGSPAPQGQTGGISVNTPVTFGVNLTAGQGSDTGVAVAEQIKSGLVQFLSSTEFIQKVTSIANEAAGVKTPPKQLPA